MRIVSGSSMLDALLHRGRALNSESRRLKVGPIAPTSTAKTKKAKEGCAALQLCPPKVDPCCRLRGLFLARGAIAERNPRLLETTWTCNQSVLPWCAGNAEGGTAGGVLHRHGGGPAAAHHVRRRRHRCPATFESSFWPASPDSLQMRRVLAAPALHLCAVIRVCDIEWNTAMAMRRCAVERGAHVQDGAQHRGSDGGGLCAYPAGRRRLPRCGCAGPDGRMVAVLHFSHSEIGVKFLFSSLGVL